MANPISNVPPVLASSGQVTDPVSIIAGTGLSGGGVLDSDRTLALAAAGVGEGSYGAASSTFELAIDAHGRVGAITLLPIQIPGSSVLPMTGLLSDTSDATPLAEVDSLLLVLAKLNNRQLDRVLLSSVGSSSTASLTTINQLSFPTEDGYAYHFQACLHFTTAIATTGLVVSLLFAGASGNMAAEARILTGADSTGATHIGCINSSGDVVVAPNAATGRNIACIDGSFISGNAASIAVAIRTEVNSSAVTVLSGSTMTVRKISTV